MIQKLKSWWYGEQKQEKPPKPEEKRKTKRYIFKTGTAYWPGSNGGHKVAWEDDHGHWHFEDLVTDFELKKTKPPELQGNHIETNIDNMTLENIEELAVFELSYLAKPYWSEAREKWMPERVDETEEWERIK